jgi:hypothetical protein
MLVRMRRVMHTAVLIVACGSEHGAVERASREQLLDPEFCGDCHAEHYAEWSASMHAYASRDPVFLAMNRRGQEETDGALGSFCVNCHAPMAVREGETSDGLNLESVPDSLQGVGCYACHNVEAVEGDHNNPLRLSDDAVLRGRLRDPVRGAPHDSEYSPLLAGDRVESAALCGACHDVVLPSPPAPAAVELERTFAQWRGSVFGPEGAPLASAVSTCSGCHVPFRGDVEPIAPGGPARNRHRHEMAAVDVPLDPFPDTGAPERDAELAAEQRAELERLLDATLRVEICVQALPGDAAAVYVTLDNASAGHDFPSGAAHDRRVWVELVAYRENTVLYQSGVVGEGEPVLAVDDADLWIFRDEVFDAAGEPAHMFWEIADYVERTIPVQVTNDPSDPRYYLSHAVRRFPRAGEESIAGLPDRVTVRVRLRPVGLDVIDDLISTGHLESSVRDAMPTLDLLPNRRLAGSEASDLASLPEVSMEWSPATMSSRAFSTREDFTVNPPRTCVGMTRR